MLQYDFEQSIGCWIFGTAHAMAKAMNEELAAHSITLRQWEVLCWLTFQGEQSQSALAENMRIEAPTLVGVLDRMERDGWIERVSDPGDRRRKLIRPTEQVEPVWAKMVACAQRVRQRATAGLSEEQRESLRDMLAQVRENLSGESCSAGQREPCAAKAQSA
jgi:MarR family transcriptional regulator for hemolysin